MIILKFAGDFLFLLLIVSLGKITTLQCFVTEKVYSPISHYSYSTYLYLNNGLNLVEFLMRGTLPEYPYICLQPLCFVIPQKFITCTDLPIFVLKSVKRPFYPRDKYLYCQLFHEIDSISMKKLIKSVNGLRRRVNNISYDYFSQNSGKSWSLLKY